MDTKIDYTIRSGFAQMDFEAITLLLKDTFWCPGIKKEEVVKGAQHSALLIGAFTSDGQQIGFSRAVSDKTRFAYILDVIVDERYRKQGIGQAMVQAILQHPDLSDVYQFLLITKDAHGVYQKHGFKPLEAPDYWMEIRSNRPQR